MNVKEAVHFINDTASFFNQHPLSSCRSRSQEMTRGMLTASKVNVLGTANMLWTVNYYDEDGRAVKSYKQHYKGNALAAGNYDEVSNSYDFTGKVTSTLRSHKVAGAEQLKVLNEYSYDHRGRKINSWETINTQPRVLRVQNEYDDMSNMQRKKLHSTDEGVSFLQSTAYNYNDRGWLARAQAPKLDVKLRYFDPLNGATPQYNGNISELEYTGTKSGTRHFKYSYDAFDRLTKADYSEGTSLDEELSYDLVGNITSLKRGAATATLYNYTTGGAGNQLRSVSGGLTGSFTYDVNGSMLTDGTRSATLTYNQLNLPATVVRSGGNACYQYDATGLKLRSVQGSTTREYISGIQYTDNVLDFVATEEGRAVRNPSTGVYKYEYNLKDHLGNVRVTIDKYGDTARVIQEDEYYAFGLAAPKYLSGDKNRYLYNGKELQEVLSNEYDYGARFYDPVIGRWNVVDPMAEKMMTWSPYTYAFNNPLRFIDIGGMVPYPITIRSFHPSASFGGGSWGLPPTWNGKPYSGDNRGFSLAANASSRIHHSVVADPEKGTVSYRGNKDTFSDASHHPTQGTATDTPNGYVGRIKAGNNSVSFETGYDGSNPLASGPTPAIDIDAKFSLTQKNGMLTVSGQVAGDNFPNTEAFITDPSGKKIFIGTDVRAAGEDNAPTILIGPATEKIMGIKMNIRTDKKGNFQQIQFGNKWLNVDDWNKRFLNQNANP